MQNSHASYAASKVTLNQDLQRQFGNESPLTTALFEILEYPYRYWRPLKKIEGVDTWEEHCKLTKKEVKAIVKYADNW